MPEIEVGDIVDVSLPGVRPRTLLQYEVLNTPTPSMSYWEFEGPKGDVVAVPIPTAVARAAPP